MSKIDLEKLTQQGLDLFVALAKAYKANNIDLVGTDVIPQRDGILSEAVNHGATAYIAGGQTGQQYFANVPQFTLPYDTFSTSTEEDVGNIVRAIPKGLCSSRVGIFTYFPIGDNLWTKEFIEHTGSQVVASNVQNLRSYFEEKNNLTHILSLAGLQAHIIPSQVINERGALSQEQIENLYAQLASPEGKIVVQYCGEDAHDIGGGETTFIMDSLESFASFCQTPRGSAIKVAEFINGANCNLSICAGNLVPSQTSLGATKCNLEEGESRTSPATLFSLMHRAEEQGITDNNIIVNVQPGTLKVVGAPELTRTSTNGVGNQLNYDFGPEITEQIYDIGYKIGTLMAKCGKVGLCGADLIITKDGQVFINEINDRQQGPTESAGLNNEANGLPALHRTSFLLNFGDLRNGDLSSYLSTLAAKSKEIYDESLRIPSPFYIKFLTLEDSIATQPMQTGLYTLDLSGKTPQWNLQDKVSGEQPIVDLNNETIILKINDASHEAGQYFPGHYQIARINGIAANKESSPFSIDDSGSGALAESWKAPIKALHDSTFITRSACPDAFEGTEITFEGYVTEHDEEQESVGQDIQEEPQVVETEAESYVAEDFMANTGAEVDNQNPQEQLDSVPTNDVNFLQQLSDVEKLLTSQQTTPPPTEQ